MVVAFFSWWYGDGWKYQLELISNRLQQFYDFFSFDLLIKTLFAPFRQISAGQVRGPLGVILRAWVDRVISRCIGALIRTFVLVFGAIAMLIIALLSLVELIIWPFLPVMPLIGAVLAITGWVPWQQ